MNNMGKLRAFAFTGMALFLASIVGFGCAKKEECPRINGLHALINETHSYLNSRELAYRRFEHEKNMIDSFEIQDNAGKSYTYFQLGKIALVRGLATKNQKTIDSTKYYYNQMIDSIDEINPSNQGALFQQRKECLSDFITYGPMGLYSKFFSSTHKPQYVDSIEKYLNLAKCANNSKTPAEVILNQNLESFRLNEIRGDYSGSINDLKTAIISLQKVPMDRVVKKQSEMFYCDKISKLYLDLGQTDSSKKYSKNAKKIAKKYSLGYLLEKNLSIFP